MDNLKIKHQTQLLNSNGLVSALRSPFLKVLTKL